MTTTTEHRFRMTLERTIRAPRERVFEAWTTESGLARWSAPEGAEVAEAEVDLRVGGRWRILMRAADGSAAWEAVGVYREITPPGRLVYTHSWATDETPVETLVTVELHEAGEATRVVMLHEGFLTEQARDGHREGWSSCLDRLETMFA